MVLLHINLLYLEKKKKIFIGDTKKIEASIIIANFLTTRNLLKLKSSLTKLTGIKA
jgi:hypothetical protein